MSKLRIEENISASEDLSIYMSKEWLSLFPKVRTFSILNKNDEPIGSFQILDTKMKGQRALITPMFTSNVSLSVKDPSSKKVGSISHQKKVFETLAEYLKRSRAKIIDLSFPTEFQDMQALQWSGFTVQPKYTFHIELQKSIDDLREQMSSSTRANLKKAIAELTVEEKNDPESFLKLCDLTFNRQNENHDRDQLEKILRSSDLGEMRSSFFVNDGKKDIASVLVVHDNSKAYYIIGGYDHNSSHRGASTLALWSAIEKMKNEGKLLFDMQGSMIPAVEQFVRGFGGDKKTYFNVSRQKWYVKIARSILGK
ncbi:MAG: GNAT family N-acetyltransferase [Flavobacteriales bacterium]|nr:GNAT family N-acetyltransferase [Flavobacteriales bacterium]